MVRWLATAREVVLSDEFQKLERSRVSPRSSSRGHRRHRRRDLDAQGGLPALLTENGRLDFLPEIATASRNSRRGRQHRRRRGRLGDRLDERKRSGSRLPCGVDCTARCGCSAPWTRRWSAARSCAPATCSSTARSGESSSARDGIDCLKRFNRPGRLGPACRGLPTCPSRLLRSAN